MGGVANSASFGCGGHWCFLSGIVVRTLQEGTCCLKKRGDFTEIREECRSETSKGVRESKLSMNSLSCAERFKGFELSSSMMIALPRSEL